MAALSEDERVRRLRQRHTALMLARQSFEPKWQDIADHMRPRGYRRYRSDVNRGDRKHQKIINFTPLKAARTLRGGMMTGITNPARPWFRFTISEPALAELPTVKEWLNAAERIVREAMAKSNIYLGLYGSYADLGPFGTTALYVEEDAEDDFRAFNFPVGSYCLAASSGKKVDTIFRTVSLTVEQLAHLFGLERCSTNVQQLHQEGKLDEWIETTHAIYPNPEYRDGLLGPQGKRWVSCWWEAKAATDGGNVFLRESGYEEFPVMAPRWEVTGEDVYGFGPGEDALGDCKALQLLERRGAQAADKHINPPMSAPVASRNTAISLLPGEVNFVDALGAGQVLRPAVQPDPRAIEVIELQKRNYEKRINEAFFADLWLLLSQSDGQMTAREVIERREEKLQQLGNVLEALQEELLDPLVTRVFNILSRRRKIPPPPPEIQGRQFKTQFISMAGQAQKVLGTTMLERLAAFVGNLAAVKPDVLDKVNFDELVDVYADDLGVPPNTTHTEDEVKQIRAARAQQAQQAQQAAQLQQGADTAKTLSETKLEDPSALNEMLRSLNAR